MDGASSPPPDAMSSFFSGDSSESRSSNSGKTTSSKPGPFSHSGSAQGAKQQLQMLTPKAMFQSVSTQLLGEKTPQQQEREQQAAAKAQERAANNQQAFQRYEAQRQAMRQQLIGEVVEMKAQAQTAGHIAEGSVLRSFTTDADKSERTLVEIALKNAQEAKAREAKARQAMMSSSPQKGPQVEGGKPKTNMFAQMQSGSENSSHKLSNDTDARQRQREQAMGE